MKSAYIRRWGFNTLDRVKGMPVTKHIEDIENHFQNLPWALEKSQEKLKNLLVHACSTTRYFNNYSDFQNLRDFPVLQKTTIRKNYDDFLSSFFRLSQLAKTQTSGSYGMPMTFYLTKEKINRRLAEIIFFNRWAGFDIGAPHLFITANNKKSKLKKFLQNEIIMNPKNLDQNWIKEKAEILKKKKIKYMVGYTSALTSIAKFCHLRGDNPEDFSLEGIITISETLFPEEKILLEKVFGCLVLSRYSTLESGVLAHQCQKGSFHVNTSSYYVEILSIDRDQPVRPGETGRVIVTDLYSQALPLIRYDTGDLAIVAEKCSCQEKTLILSHIEGRIVEKIYDTIGNKVYHLAILIAMRKIEDILRCIIQFQFIQKQPSRYLIKLVVLSPVQDEEIIRDGFRQLLGVDAEIEIEYPDSIPPLKSGKRPHIINELAFNRPNNTN